MEKLVKLSPAVELLTCKLLLLIQDYSTWIYENRVSKHFVKNLNFPCLSLFTVLFLYVASYLGCFMVGCRSGCAQNFVNFYLTSPLSSLYPSLVFFHS